jgi:thioredoxin-like negative regulator of GroEL
MIERLILSFFLIAIVPAGAKIILSFLAWRTRRTFHVHRISAHLPRPVLLYFWSDRCTQCKTQEREISAAQNILRQFGKQFDIRKINALEDRKTAELYRVMTVPTVILLDEDEQPVAVHPGFTRAKTISEQYLRSA